MDGKTFVDKIDEILKSKGLKRQDLSDYCDITAQAISEWSRKDRIPNALLVIKISNFLGVSSEWLLRDDDQEQWRPYKDPEGIEVIDISPQAIKWRIIYHLQTELGDFSANFNEKFFSKILHIFSIDQLTAMGTNKYIPSIQQLYLTSTCLHLPLEYLITGHNKSRVNEPDYFIYGLAQKYLDLLKVLNCLHDDEKNIIKQHADIFFINRIKIREALQVKGIDISDIPELN